MNIIRTKYQRDSGATIVEYGLIVAVVALMSLSAATLLGERTEQTFTGVTHAMAGDEGSDPASNESEDSNDSGESEQGDPEQGDSGVNEIAPGLSVTGITSDFTWWNTNGGGGNGEWKASVSFDNDTNRHQYLKLYVTTVDDKGRTTTTTVDSFYVPAHGSSTYSHWGNELRVNPSGLHGVTEVTAKVVSVTTSDENWSPFTFDVTADPTSVGAPPTP